MVNSKTHQVGKSNPKNYKQISTAIWYTQNDVLNSR